MENPLKMNSFSVHFLIPKKWIYFLIPKKTNEYIKEFLMFFWLLIKS